MQAYINISKFQDDQLKRILSSWHSDLYANTQSEGALQH